MDGLHEMVSAGAPIVIGGKTYFLNTLKAKHWGEAARALIAKRKPPMAIAKEHLPGMPAEAQRALVELAYKDERDGELVPNYEIDRWFRTNEGFVWNFWAQIRQAHPEITIEQAEALLTQLDAETAAKAAKLTKDNEALPQGNSSGLAQQILETEEAGGSTANGRCRGAASSVS